MVIDQKFSTCNNPNLSPKLMKQKIWKKSGLNFYQLGLIPAKITEIGSKLTLKVACFSELGKQNIGFFQPQLTDLANKKITLINNKVKNRSSLRKLTDLAHVKAVFTQGCTQFWNYRILCNIFIMVWCLCNYLPTA